jgi:multiple sugar transport system substrate-binding protein
MRWALIVAIVLGLLGCERHPQRRDAVELRLWNGFTGPDGRTMLGIVKKFNDENADVHVVMQRLPWGQYYNKLFVAGSGGRAPDVFVSHRSALQRFVAAGFVRDADDLLGKSADQIDPGDIDANVLQAFEHDGRHWAIPLDVHPLGMYYNRALLRGAGFDHPPATREEFLQLLRRLRPRPDAPPRTAKWGFAVTWQRTNCYTAMRQFGGELFSADGSQPTFPSPANVAGLDFFASLIRDGMVPSPQDFDAWTAFRQGRVAMVFEGIYMLPDLLKQSDLDWAAAPVPTLGEHPAAWADSHGLAMRNDLASPRLAAARRFVKYLSDHSLDWAAGGQVPVRKSLRDSDRFRAMPAQTAFARQIPYVAYFPPTPFIFEYFRAFDDAVELALRGTKTSSAALTDSDRSVKTVMERYSVARAASP